MNEDFLSNEYENPINEKNYQGNQVLGREKARKKLYQAKKLTGQKLEQLFQELERFIIFCKCEMVKNIFKQRVDILCPSYLYDYAMQWLEDEGFDLTRSTLKGNTQRERIPFSIEWGKKKEKRTEKTERIKNGEKK